MVARCWGYSQKCQCDPPVGWLVQVWVPSALVVQVVCEDGAVLLETSIHPRHENAARTTSTRIMLVMFRMRI
jgi:hypothetical protein